MLAGIGLPTLDDATGLTLRLKGELTATGSLFDLGVRCEVYAALVPR